MDAGPRATAIDEPNGALQLSQDGEFVAFATRSQLIPSDTDNSIDIYIRDNKNGTYDRVSAPTDGTTSSDGDSTQFSMQSDSSYIAFIGNSTYLPGGCAGCIYLRNRQLNTTTALTDAPVSSMGMDLAAITLVYNQPVPGDNNAVFVKNLLSNTAPQQLTLPPNLPSFASPGEFSVSIGGGVIAFALTVNRTVNGTPEQNRRVLVYKNVGGSYQPINIGGPIPGTADLTASLQEPASAPFGHGASEPQLSGDGRYLAFFSEFADLVPGDTNQGGDIFYRDLGSPGFPMTRISVLNDGSQVPGSFSAAPAMTADGRYVAFEADDGATPPQPGWFGTSCDCGYIALWDRNAAAGQHLSLGSRTWDGRPDNTYPERPAMSVDGRFIAYSTGMPDATPGPPDDDGLYDMVMWDRSASYVHNASVAPGGTVQSQATLDAANPVGMRVTVPTGGDVLVTKSRRHWTPSPNAVPVDVTFQAVIPTQSAATPATAQFGLDASVHAPGIDQQRLTVLVDGVELPTCPSPTTLPGGATACERPPVFVMGGGREIDVLTTGSLGNDVYLVWGHSTSSPDLTAPDITVNVPADGASYTLGALSTPTYNCTDTQSPVQTCAPIGALDLSAGTHTFTVSASDSVGNTTQKSVTYTIVDGSASGTIDPGSTITTDPSGVGATPEAPLQTAITPSVGGLVSISTSAVTQGTPTAYDVLGDQVNITAPDGSVAAPLSLTFTIDASLLGPQPDGSIIDASNLTIMRDGVPITTACDGSGQALPVDPCVRSRTTNTGGDAVITVLSVHASKWNAGHHKAYKVSSPFFGSPLSNTARNYAKAGSVIGFKFSLGGNQGLDIFAAESPSSLPFTPCPAPTGKVSSIGSSSNAATLTYVKSTNSYTYNWKTLTGWLGTCRTFAMKLADGTQHTASFYFTK